MEDLDKLTAAQLKVELKKRGAVTKGRKAVLKERLEKLLESEKASVDSSGADKAESGTDRPTGGQADLTPCQSESDSPSVRGASITSSCASVSIASFKSLRAIESAKQAGLQARAAYLKERQKIEEDEIRMRIRKEQVEISAEIAESQAKERVLRAAEISEESSQVQISSDELLSTEIFPQPRAVLAAIPEQQKEKVSSAKHSQQQEYSEAFLRHLKQAQLPAPEIPVFTGDITKYHSFIRAFDSRICSKTDDPDERLYYLQMYVRGKPLDIIQGCMHMSDGAGYVEARHLLERRYGDPDGVSSAFVDILMEWSPIKPGDVDSLDRFSIALTSCLNVMQDIPPGARETDHPRTMRRIVDKLPYHCQDSWRGRVIQIKEGKGKVRFEDIVEFVDREVRKLTDPTFGKLARVDRSGKQAHSVSATAVERNARQPGGKCLYCNKEHYIDSCEDLMALTYDERKDFIMKRRLCFGCLRQGHQASTCRIRLSCKSCEGRHPTALHGKQVEESPGLVSASKSVASSTISAGTRGESSAMMAIIPVKVHSPDGLKSITTHAFLDLGSSATFCTPSLLHKLNVKGKPTNLNVTTAVSENQSIKCQVVNGLVMSGIEGVSTIQLPPTYTLDKIPVNREDIATDTDIKNWAHLDGIQMTRTDADIELMLGGNCPEALCPLEIRKGVDGAPFAFRTQLGWVVYGPRGYSSVVSPARVNRVSVKDNLHEKFAALYNQDFGDDSSSTDVGLSVEDKKWLNAVERGTRYKEGRYEIPLPLKNDEAFPNNKAQALHRVEHLKRKMKRSEKYMEDYTNFVNGLIEKNYAERVAADQLHVDKDVWYIPHHGVYHPTKPDKIRVVYDCSASFRNVSLNSRLMQGPNLTSSLIGVLLRFREGPFAVMGDIEKMFYQVRVPQRQRNLLRFLWWPHGDVRRALEEYQVNVHLFGAVSSPSCANFALRKSAHDFGDAFRSEVRHSITRSFYVDDYLKSCSSINELREITQGVTQCCAKGGFRLTGFVSNNPAVLLGFPYADCVSLNTVDLTGDKLSNHRALGVQWDTLNDTLSFRIDVHKGPATRRGILGTVSSVYDPLGLGSPFILRAKILLQDLCRLNVGWDDPIPDIHSNRWEQWCEQLEELRTFSVPRSLTPISSVQSCQLHLFADASESGYGSVAYIRTLDTHGSVSTSLLMSKARVAPIKPCSIPRLELAAATLAVQLSTQILGELELPTDEVFFWTDSMSTLRYIQNETSRFQTFVANRLAVIHDGSRPLQWRYVPSALNIADVLSRGISATDLKESRWINGPFFLAGSESDWPKQPDVQSITDDEPMEVKKGLVNATDAEEDHTSRLFHSVSDWHKLKTRVAWMLRLKHILRQRAKHRQDILNEHILRYDPTRLSVDELNMAESAIIRHTQQLFFPGELSSDSIKRSSPVYRLNPHLIDGVLRVGGRLDNARLPDQSKHQMILPKNSHVTDVIIRDMHERKGHSGREHVLASLRSKYWIVNGNAAVRRVLSKCVRCKKIQAPVVTQIMSDLPAERTTVHKGAFSHVGTDFFGPFYIKLGRKQFKRFAVLFSCLSTRATHIEVCESLDTSSFINALRRFQARRGQVTYIRSDNGTNFVAAEKELRKELSKLEEKRVHDFLLKEDITWVFNPPGASSHGGVWERQIRTIRKVLNAILREQTLTHESLCTLLCEVEAIMNSTPITTVSSDPMDLQPLTPNDLLLLRGSVPDSIFRPCDGFAARRWRQIQYLADVFWKRWVREYLPLLQTRQKWNKIERNLTVNDVVLIVDRNSPRCRWPLGRVTEVFSDRKGLVRSALVRTATSIFKRPISKLVLVLETGL